jgi:hypothetical protein
MANMRGTRGVNKARGLLTVDSLIEMTVQEGIFDIQLVNGPGMHGGNAENKPNSCRFHHRTESLGVINATLLSETTDYPTSLVPRK